MTIAPLRQQAGCGSVGVQTTSEPAASHNRRLIAFGVLVVLAAATVLIGPLHRWLLSIFAVAEGVMQSHQLVGMIAFVALAALSAMFAFLSSTLLVPVAIEVWGPAASAGLLWVGWLLGGLAAYGMGRSLGRPVTRLFVAPGTLDRYEGWIRARASLSRALLIQLAMPSDAAGYLFGIVRFPLLRFSAGLALAEIPYALGTVYLGVSFLERRLMPLLAVGLLGVLLGLLALRAARLGAAGTSPS
jgi:uncharacterized membrane protein YdjX (TVP38/TMEM64 family)